MPARRTGSPISDDLFSAVANEAAPAGLTPSPTGPPAPLDPSPRYLLPKDLPSALARLEHREIDLLIAAIIAEARRRGRLTPGAIATLLGQTKGADDGPRRRTSVPASASRQQWGPIDDHPYLTVGQRNAVRNAFMAGVKPTPTPTIRDFTGSCERGPRVGRAVSKTVSIALDR